MQIRKEISISHYLNNIGMFNKFSAKATSFAKYFKTNYVLYLMLIPGLLYLFIYKFTPLLGLVIAFKDYNVFLGDGPVDAVIKSEWVGLYHYKRLFGDPYFLKVFMNTLTINVYKIIFLFPLPIIFAILLNEVRNKAFKKFVQTSVYIPYFFSWVIVFGIFYSILGSYGIVNTILKSLGFGTIKFFTNKEIFRPLLIVSEGWKAVQ